MLTWTGAENVFPPSVELEMRICVRKDTVEFGIIEGSEVEKPVQATYIVPSLLTAT